MSTKDYLNMSDSALDSFMTRNLAYIADKTIAKGATPPEWMHIPSERTDEVGGKAGDFHDALEKLDGPHMDGDKQAKKDAKAALIKIWRPYKRQFLDFSPVTDADRVNMGLPLKDIIPTPINAPQLPPEFEVRYIAKGIIDVGRFRPANGAVMEDKRAYHGVAIHCGIMNATPQNSRFNVTAVPLTGYDLPYSEFCRTKWRRFGFSGESGARLFICAQYESAKAQKGPFGAVVEVVIP